MGDWANAMGIEAVYINKNTTIRNFKRDLFFEGRSFMSTKILTRITVGDMLLCYEIEEESKLVGFTIIPNNLIYPDEVNKNYKVSSLIQLKLIGDIYPDRYAQGSTMRESGTSNAFKYEKQEIVEEKGNKQIITTLKDSRGYVAKHIVTYHQGDFSFELKTEFENASDETVTLEMISSFELGNITPFISGDAPDSLLLHRLRSKWSHEARLHTETIEDLQLEPTWDPVGVSVERFGQIGSMPVKKFYPFVGIEDKLNHVLWGAQLAHSASWQMEVYRRDDGLHISGGLADREFGHWTKQIYAGETFVTPTAILTCCVGDIEVLTQRLTQAAEKHLDNNPKSEEELPIIFNEYCTTWGCPSHENICTIVNTIKEKGIEYFVMDCGWYKADGVPWYTSMGDYDVSTTLFPDGLDKTVSIINDAGMKAGIWFEIDTIGSVAKAYKNTEHHLKRDGYPITTYSRRYWDMNDPWVNRYLTEKVICTLKKYGFEYIKMDYNDTIGFGCDNKDSLGEGLRKNVEASVNFIKKIKEEVPGIIIENCASGGHRLEPLLMSICSMGSFSDAHECREIPIIAANLHRAILPRQSQIWAVIRKEDSLKRIAYSIAATFLGRMCLSGDVVDLSKEQWRVIDDGIEFYKEIKSIIKNGFTRRYGSSITSERHPRGWQGVVRVGKAGKALVLVHTFMLDLPECMEIKLPEGCPMNIIKKYSDCEFEVKVKAGVICFKTNENWKAMAVVLG